MDKITDDIKTKILALVKTCDEVSMKSVMFHEFSPEMTAYSLEKYPSFWQLVIAKPQHREIYKVIDNEFVYHSSEKD